MLVQRAVEELQAAVDASEPLATRAPPMSMNAQRAAEVVAYAHRLSYTTSAPPGFVPGQTPLGHFKPPAPQDAQLRSCQLHEFQSERCRQRAERGPPPPS